MNRGRGRNSSKDEAASKLGARDGGRRAMKRERPVRVRCQAHPNRSQICTNAPTSAAGRVQGSTGRREMGVSLGYATSFDLDNGIIGHGMGGRSLNGEKPLKKKAKRPVRGLHGDAP